MLINYFSIFSLDLDFIFSIIATVYEVIISAVQLTKAYLTHHVAEI